MKIASGLVLSLLFFASIGLADQSAPAAASPAAAPAPAKTESGWLGVSLGPMPGLPPALGQERMTDGVKVIGVVQGSPAQKSGLRVRDIILSVDGKPVSSPQDVISIVTSLSPGTSLSLNVSRRGVEKLMTPSLAVRPSDANLMRMYDGWIGVEAIELPASLREHFGAPADSGVMISSVKAGSPAEAAGLSVGDVIFEFEGDPVRSVNSLRSLIASSGVDNRVEMKLMRDGAEIVVEPLVASRPDRDDRQ